MNTHSINPKKSRLKKNLFIGIGLCSLATLLLVDFGDAKSNHERSGVTKNRVESRKDSEVGMGVIAGRETDQANNLKNKIKSVAFEPAKPCAGDQFVMNVELDSGSEGVDLHVNGVPGGKVSLAANSEGMSVPVLLRDSNGQVASDSFKVPVRACAENRPQIALTTETLPDEEDSIGFSVRSLKGLGSKVTYEWDFGDESPKIVGNEAYVAHSFKLRQQDGPASVFIAKVTATDEKGKQAISTTTVRFPNTNWIVSQYGKLILPTDGTTNFQQEKKTFAMSFRSQNFSKHEIELNKATLEFIPCKADAPSHKAEVDAKSILADTAVMPGQVYEAEFEYAPKMEGHVCGVNVNINGMASIERLPARISFRTEFGAREGLGQELQDRDQAIAAFKASIQSGYGRIHQSDVQRVRAQEKLDG